MLKVFRILGLSLIKAVFIMGNAQASELQQGAAAPAFSLVDQNKQMHNLADYQGQWLVLYFYPKDDTPGCTTEACTFRDDYLQIKALKAAVVGISLDDASSHKEFARKYKLPFPLLADTDGKVSIAYDTLWKMGPIKFAKRHTFIIGPDGLIKKIYRDVEPKQHSQQIIADLKTLIAAQSK